MQLEVYSDAEVQAMAPATLLAHIARVQRHIDRAAAYQRRLMAEAEQQQAAQAVGEASVADALVRAVGISRREARRAQRQAKAISTQPAVADALAAGLINTDQAEAIARSEVCDETRGQLLRAASSETTDMTRERAKAAEIAQRDETPNERLMRQHANRYCRIFDARDGMVGFRGALDPESGAHFRAYVTAISERMWRDDKQLPPRDRRTPEQREADALWAAVCESRFSDADGGGRAVPVMQVATGIEDLREELERRGIATGTTASGEELSGGTLRRLACDAEIIPTVLGGGGRVIDVGRRSRVVGEALRCVLTARDNGCVWHGCDAPPSRCHAHHVIHWADGGPTDADNLALLCHSHHILLHEGGYRLSRHDDAWVVLKPDGSPLHGEAGDTGVNGSGRVVRLE